MSVDAPASPLSDPSSSEREMMLIHSSSSLEGNPSQLGGSLSGAPLDPPSFFLNGNLILRVVGVASLDDITLMLSPSSDDGDSGL